MKRVLLARDSADGVLASVIVHRAMETRYPLFAPLKRTILNYEHLNVPICSVGVPVREAELYIDNQGSPRDNGSIVRLGETLSRIAFSLFPDNRYEMLVSRLGNANFQCFFELYGASSCFGQLIDDPDSWLDSSVVGYKAHQERLADEALSTATFKKDFAGVVLPEMHGRYCRELIFDKADVALAVMVDFPNIYAYSRRDYVEAVAHMKEVRISERKENYLNGILLKRLPFVKLFDKAFEKLESVKLDRIIMER